MEKSIAVLGHEKRVNRAAQKIIERHVIYATGASLIPVPMLDVATLLGVQVSMVEQLGRQCGLEGLKRSRVKRLVRILIADLAAMGVLSGVKAIPLVGPIVGMLGAPAYAIASTYAVGRVFLLHFSQGGTLLDFDPQTTRDYFRREYERALEAQPEESYSAPPPAKDPKSKRQSELSAVSGIADKTSELLNRAGIYTYDELADTPVEQLQRILDEGGTRFNHADPTTWPTQAGFIVKGQWEELEKFNEIQQREKDQSETKK